MLKLQGDRKNAGWYVGTLAIISLCLLVTIDCYAEPGRPDLVLTGKTVFGERKSTLDSKLELKWDDLSVNFTGTEIVEAFGLYEGSLLLNKRVLSTKSGLPVIDYYCHCDDGDPHRIHVSVDEVEQDIVVTLRDSLVGERLSEVGKKCRNLVVGKDRNIPSKYLPVPLAFSLRENLLKVPQDGRFNLEKVLNGGEWRKIEDINYKGYDGVVQWECKTDIPKGHYCYCDPGLPIDMYRDGPTCWGYLRKANVAFKRTDNNMSLEFVVFEINFEAPSDSIFPQRWGAAGEAALFRMENLQ